jgi:hypothetical protein
MQIALKQLPFYPLAHYPGLCYGFVTRNALIATVASAFLSFKPAVKNHPEAGLSQ